MAGRSTRSGAKKTDSKPSSSSHAPAAVSKSGAASSKKGAAGAKAAKVAVEPKLSPSGLAPVCFWKREHPTLGYMCQWYYLPFRDRSEKPVVYPTCEHYMMYHKAMLFGDAAIAADILATEDPKSVKALGRAVKNFDEDTWNRERVRIVTEGNYCRFTYPVRDGNDEELAEGSEAEPKTWFLGNGAEAESFTGTSFREVLLATGDAEIVETSPLDRIWGVGFGAANAEANRGRWGLNLLGKCLMDVREMFRKELEESKETEKNGNGEKK